MSNTNPKKIFIVDDDEMLTEALSDYINRECSHTIRVFRTGEACLPFLSEDPDFIILDFHLNTIDKNAKNGLEILREIRKTLPHSRVIMLSSQESYATALTTVAKGAENYIIKDKEAFEKIAKLIS